MRKLAMFSSLKHCACAFPSIVGGGGLNWSSCKVLTAVSSRTGFFSRSPPSSLNLEDVKAAEVETAVEKLDNTSLTTRGPLPIITKRELTYLPPAREIRQAWVENLDTIEEKKLGLIDLHPDVWATFPRIEQIQANLRWQIMFRKINWNWAPTRGEIKGTNKKPWPQKGMGKARHGSRKGPIWLRGAKAHGPRGPKTYFYMLPFYKRIHGLCSTLSVKLAQDDLKIVDTLDIPSQDPKYLEDLISHRNWGLSVLFVDDTDIAPVNLAMATDNVGHLNIMPVYGLNVYSMLKHDTLVLTLAAVNKIEEKLVMHLNRNDPFPPGQRKIHPGQPM